MSVIGTIHEDVTTDVLGNIGTWQWLVTFVSAAMMLPALFNQYEDSFLLQPTNVLCVPPQRVAVYNTSICYVTVEVGHDSNVGMKAGELKCSKWHVKLMWLIWLKKSWLMFCDQRLKLLSTSIIYRFGLIFGCIIYGLVSDSFGRKMAVMIDIFVTLVLEIVLVFCDSEGWFRLFVFLKALFGGANLYMGLLIVCEIASNSWRFKLTMIVIIPRLIAMVCVVPFVNALFNMETYGFIAALLYLMCAGLLRWLPESPQWLLHNRKTDVAEQILKNAAKINGISLCSDFKIRPVSHRAYNSLDELTTCVGVLSIDNIRTLFMVTMSFWTIFCFLWSSLYVRIYSEERVSDLLFKVFLFTGLFSSLTILASQKVAIRYLLLLHSVLTGAITMILVFIGKGFVRVLVSSAAISAGMVVHALILNITPRLFAINIRASALGCCHASGQLGATISYFLYLFQPISDVMFLFTVLAATLALVGLCFVLPNVEGRELPDLMMDMDYYSELSKPLRWATQKTSSLTMEEVEMKVHSFGSRRTASLNSHAERLPAQKIGFSKLWRDLVEYLRRKFNRRK